jgi:ubiquinone/menaquinone biosynthesis C-methylase UbiE/ribosomal protein S18 acetylase RimI-like enzyme
MNQSASKDIKVISRRGWEILRKEGLRSLWFKFLGETIYRRMDLIEKKVSPASTRPGFADGQEISFLTPGEVDEFLAFRAYIDHDTVLERLASGQICFLVREHGQIIHNTWVATGRLRIDYLDCEIKVANNTLYVFEAYTSPDFRGRSISSIRSFALEKYCHEQGYKRLLAVVWPENPAVYRSLEKAGYTIVGRAGYRGAGRFRRHFCRYQGEHPPFLWVAKPDNKVPAFGDQYWDHVPGKVDAKTHYLDPFLAQMKRQENLRLLREWGEVRPESRLLKTDVFEEAMGGDAFLADLQAENVKIAGIDVSPVIVRRAADNHTGQALSFLAADVRRLPFRDSIFSTVVSPSTLDHFPDPSDLGVSLRELFRVIEPGGRLVITLDNRQNIFDPLLRLVHQLGLVPYFIGRSYTIDELRNELRDAGFEVTETTAILHNPRLVAVGAMRVVRWLGWRWLIRLMQRLFLAAQGLEKTRLCYYTGSFVAAQAIRPEPSAKVEDLA